MRSLRLVTLLISGITGCFTSGRWSTRSRPPLRPVQRTNAQRQRRPHPRADGAVPDQRPHRRGAAGRKRNHRHQARNHDGRPLYPRRPSFRTSTSTRPNTAPKKASRRTSGIPTSSTSQPTGWIRSWISTSFRSAYRGEVNGKPAAVDWWVDDVQFDEEGRRDKKVEPPDPNSWTRQLNIGPRFRSVDLQRGPQPGQPADRQELEAVGHRSLPLFPRLIQTLRDPKGAAANQQQDAGLRCAL